jgi:hypothetical protein
MEPYFSLNRALIEPQQRLNSALILSSDKERAHPPSAPLRTRCFLEYLFITRLEWSLPVARLEPLSRSLIARLERSSFYFIILHAYRRGEERERERERAIERESERARERASERERKRERERERAREQERARERSSPSVRLECPEAPLYIRQLRYPIHIKYI